ncbi:MAG: bifunctional methionine sulfoxide reductase B/A protein [Holophagales bacterium]|nr:bifunctional methionine sulfoxide reductase B/A protein [Holophagales bacterium]
MTTTQLSSTAREAHPAPGRRLVPVSAIAVLGAALGLAACRPAQTLADPAPGKEATSGKAKTMNTVLSKSGYDITPLPKDEVARLAAKLDPEAYRITQKAGTEPAFCGNLLDNKKDGVYTCVVCGLPLFSSEHKFNSGTGWPSFFREVDPAHVTRKVDRAFGMERVEIDCARCGAHLGHVFEDGPKPTGERHCLNSASLKFLEKGAPVPPESQPVKVETAYFAAGCFWGVEHWFKRGPGVLDAVSGYMQGHTDNPTYKDVCSDTTGHAESVKVTYDANRITYRRLVEAFFAMHDPTQLNRQGPDVGDQYRSGIWTVDEGQKKVAEEVLGELKGRKVYGEKAIVTIVEPAKTFWPAEEYHQEYLAKNGASCHVKNPW